MKKTLLLFFAVLATMLCAVTVKAQEIPNPEPVRNTMAVYNDVDNTVTLTGKAPSYTEYDWDYTYTNYPLDHSCIHIRDVLAHFRIIYACKLSRERQEI